MLFTYLSKIAYITKFENQHSLGPSIYLNILGQVAKFNSVYLISKRRVAAIIFNYIKSESCYHYFILINQCYHDKQKTTKKNCQNWNNTKKINMIHKLKQEMLFVMSQTAATGGHCELNNTL